MYRATRGQEKKITSFKNANLRYEERCVGRFLYKSKKKSYFSVPYERRMSIESAWPMTDKVFSLSCSLYIFDIPTHSNRNTFTADFL